MFRIIFGVYFCIGLFLVGYVQGGRRVTFDYDLKCQEIKAFEKCRIVKDEFIHYFERPLFKEN